MFNRLIVFNEVFLFHFALFFSFEYKMNFSFEYKMKHFVKRIYNCQILNEDEKEIIFTIELFFLSLT